MELAQTGFRQQQQKNGAQNGIGKISKRTGRVFESRPQKQVASNRISRERREAAGDYHVVRQFQRPVATGCAFATGLQARDIDGHAGPAGSIVRRGWRRRNGLTQMLFRL